MRRERSYGFVMLRHSSLRSIRLTSDITSLDEVEVLLIHQRSGGHWSFPKGHEEPGETPIVTARRELFEETGLRAKPELWCAGEIYWESYTFQHPRKGAVNKTNGFFVGVVEDGPEESVKIQEEEVLEAKWCSFATAMVTLTFSEEKDLLNRVRSRLERDLEKKQSIL
ncbi:hypothetical protein M427DRAFT_59108 [Gonapodya prolifera JEL478]|uniref:Nudix hydrolase domain-containing protein n=1 Tax=Gonapodya prolifera (strain JEL478) TaxID=1344416 RepID=A0A139A9C8_GONPJ|nr:hypothetical protein M427DRAFT_59108 [Gonapodya prolifera JEL478]|eukprot:KXS13003.1 hypothetical protein M427DRAFT_59108 [Gonapodya prolifera JEL478]